MSPSRTLTIGCGIVLSVMMLGAAPALALSPTCAVCFHTLVDYKIDTLQYDVSDIVVFALTKATSGSDPLFESVGLTSAPSGASTVTADFRFSAPIDLTFMIGETNEVPGESGGALVLFTNNAFAGSSTGQSFDTLFSALLTYDLWYTDQGSIGSIAGESTPADGEATLVSDLPTWKPFGDIDLGHFAGGDGSAPGGALPGALSVAGFAPGDSFTAIAFSSGQIIGTGTSELAPAPEPGAWAMILVGLGGLGATSRARRRADRGRAPAGA